MGLPLVFQAIPETGPLFTRLETDRLLGDLLANLYSMGGGPFTWAGLDDLGESLQDFVEEGHGSRADVDRAMSDLLAAFESARASHPGLEKRWVYLDKTQNDIEDAIVQRLRGDGQESAIELVSDLFHGERRLRSWSDDVYDPLRLITAVRVRLVAEVLERLDGESLFGDDPRDLCEDYSDLRTVTLESAEQDEALIVGS